MKRVASRRWVRHGWLLGAACAACCVSPGLAQAAGPEGLRSTDAYLQASYAFVRAELRDVGESAASIAARAGAIAGECPSALTFAPRDSAFGEVAEAIDRGVWLANAEPVRSATLRFASRVGRLEWADRKLTKLVGAQAAWESWAAMVTPPAMCAAITAWKASAYTALPAAVGAFLSRQEALEEAVGFSEESLEERIERRLRRYEDPRERRLAGEVERLERVVYTRLHVAQTAARRELEAALGVSSL